ncbi:MULTISPECIES: RrF2 family transcriptional regulator [Brucella/Ochrobactrum group]|uniref:Rrf2 family transcriptional regulator n=3 Tax=Ochrobactrum TaxID=528 RepID=A0ABY2Y547_9HYPH|nr:MULTISPECIES: Rrf2 family transcriptional regulator [Brucella]MCI1001553.1 Rrf2 family transcriptional regulator [Ochrobactrum sp. C6C9]RRD26443.1 Rrf2 family transcriptional regulator [Brucellaceae bacterium VT-16-1752]NNU59889.1 Rrf2 family transcriptional regulator [[Ochrobactrum] soli]RLL74582.1 Rrf2 family transcriptional regulator [[Ochrobactrum] soli]TNV14131.1 Rrf2 family transcriptional regulator [[Ochrobactrum] teleogrylli]
MRQDSRLSRMLHVLIHMDHHDGAMTSEEIAAMLDTNSVVIRRTMAGLRKEGYVHSEKGHGGGWTLARPLDQLTLLDIYRAVGEPSIFAVGPAYDMPGCVIEQAVNKKLESVFKEAEQLLLSRLQGVTLADIAQNFSAGMAANGHAAKTKKTFD